MSTISGFHYKGKDKRGVSKWRGSGNWQRVLRVIGVGFSIYGVCTACVFVALLLFALLTLSWPPAFHALVLVSGIHALVFGSTGVWARNFGREINAMHTAEQLAARFGMNEETLAAVAQDNGIKPRLNINGMDYYHPAAFADASAILLRGSTRPEETQEVLLRPATADAPTNPEQLLRVPDTTGEPMQVLNRTQTEPSAESIVQELRQH